MPQASPCTASLCPGLVNVVDDFYVLSACTHTLVLHICIDVHTSRHMLTYINILVVKGADILQSHYHPGTFSNNRWSCCEHRSKHSHGCKETFIGKVH